MDDDYLSIIRDIYHVLAHGTKLTYAAIGVGLLVAFFYFKIFFRDISGFQDDAEESGKEPLIDPDYDHINSQWSGMKITIWLMLSFGAGMLAYHQLPQWFPHLFRTP